MCAELAGEPTMIDLADKFGLFTDLWSPKTVAAINDMRIKVVKVQGEFVWHTHDDTDELFLVHSGRLTIELRSGDIVLGPGQLFVVPRGVAHRPVASEPCELLLLEPAGVVNTGDGPGGDLTAPEEWV